VRIAALAVWIAVSLGAPTADAQVGWVSPAAGPTLTGDPEVIFTFDDGPDPVRTPAILDILAKYQISAIFFTVGRMVEAPAAKAILDRILREGHVIANHTMTHGDLCRIKDDAAAAAEIDLGRAAIENAAGWHAAWFRAPYGARCPRLEAMLAERGISHFHWDLDPKEWQHGSAKRTLEYLIKQLGRMQGRNVLLMHDIKLATVVALPQALEWIATENERRKALRIRRIRIVQAYEIAWERVQPGLLDWVGAIMPGKELLAHAIASVLP
jgi:peptidoglycan/xylan/chitin deacetylase (PgdA/CDA1 family)